MYKYEHGGSIRFKRPEVIDFSANINPLGLPLGVSKAIVNSIENCTVYPDSFSTSLRQSISNFEGISHEYIICANGASDLIFRLAFTLRPKKALVLAPTFSDYERSLIAAHCKIYYHYLYEETNFELNEDILPLIAEEEFDLIYICNPNNPTGCVVSKDLIRKIVDLCNKSNSFVAIDECFMDFVNESENYTIKPLIHQYKNIIIIKAFTKIFALAGVRLGYGLCSDTAFIDRLYAHSPDWSVSALAQVAGISALQNPKHYLQNTINFVESEKRKLVASLEYLGFIVFGSKANYIFFKSPYTFNIEDEILDNHGIYIRSCGNYQGLNNRFYRIGILSKEHNERLIHALQNLTTLRRK